MVIKSHGVVFEIRDSRTRIWPFPPACPAHRELPALPVPGFCFYLVTPLTWNSDLFHAGSPGPISPFLGFLYYPETLPVPPRVLMLFHVCVCLISNPTSSLHPLLCSRSPQGGVPMKTFRKPLGGEGNVLLFQQDTFRDEYSFWVFHQMALAHHPSFILVRNICFHTCVTFTSPRTPGSGCYYCHFPEEDTAAQRNAGSCSELLS